MLKQYFFNPPKKTKQITSALVVLIVAAVGTYFLVGSHAATPYVSVTADKGTLAGGATLQSCTGASDGSCVVFGSSTSGGGGGTGTKLRVSVNSIAGFGAAISGGYVSNWFTKIGVTWGRFDIGSGSGISIATDSYNKNPAEKTMMIYSGDSTDGDSNCQGTSISQVTTEITNLIPQLKSYYASTGQPPELEFCNESSNTLNATQYAALYNAAHVLTQPAGIKLLAWAGTTTANKQHGGSGTWFHDLAAALPGGAGEVDAFVYHPYPNSPTTFTTEGQLSTDSNFWTNWEHIKLAYSESTAAGFSSTLPWYMTEFGVDINLVGGNQTTVATDLTWMFNQILTMNGTGGWPNVVFANWYSSFDDGSGGFGLLNTPVTSPSGRPAYDALQTWMAAHTSVTNG